MKKISSLTAVIFSAAIIAAVFGFCAITRRATVDSQVMGAIVPHHAPLTGLIEETLEKVSQEKHPKIVILIGPNHEDAGIGPALTRVTPWELPVGTVPVNVELTQEFIHEGLALVDEKVIVKDHSMYTVLPVIKKYFPDAKVVTIILSSKHDKNRSKRLGEKIGSLLTEDTLLIASIDFSHYLSSDIAPLKDAETLALIEKREYEKIERTLTDHFDSAPSLMTFLRAVDFADQSQGELVHHTNSGLFAGEPIQSSTSYMTFIFRR